MNHNMQMQKETGKILHRKFLSENIGLLLMAPVFLLLMFIVSNLYQLPAEYAFYLTSIFLILWVTTLCMQYRGFRKRTEQYEKESKEKQESNSKESRQWEELQEKQDFFALWAHQIKTPIAAMRLLLQTENTLQNEELGEQLFKIEQYVEMVLQYLRMDNMNSDLLIRQHSLDKIVKQAVRKYAKSFIRRKISLDYEELGCRVITDEKWLVFVIEQLLSNAIKYTRSGKISIYMAPRREKTLVIEDTGIGIQGEDLPRIFEKGYTGYNGRTDKKSTGIGLYLCKSILTKLNHSIWIESEPREGTRVYLDLKSAELQID